MTTAATSERAAIVRWLRASAESETNDVTRTAINRAIVEIIDGEHLDDEDDTEIFTDLELELNAAFRLTNGVQ